MSSLFKKEELPLPFKVRYPRTAEWWEKDWRVLSDWCSKNISASKELGEWDYYGGYFLFQTEEAAMLFTLRWSK